MSRMASSSARKWVLIFLIFGTHYINANGNRDVPVFTIRHNNGLSINETRHYIKVTTYTKIIIMKGVIPKIEIIRLG